MTKSNRKMLLRPIPLAIAATAAAALFALLWCRDCDLRGNWTKSSDGSTYLIIESVDGWPPEGSRHQVDCKDWPHAVGQPGRIEAGVHWIGCERNGIGFNVAPGVVYRFTYWGP